MPLRLEIKKKLNTRTERVKSVDFHPTNSWVLSALYSGHLMIHNWEEQATVRTIEVCPNTAIRCAKFIARKQWVICGSDDMQIRVFNYHSMEKVKQFEAHSDFIRHIAIHSTLPYVLTSSDDMTVRLWDWSKDWSRVASFEGHFHYVMMAQWNPKDPHIFATASLDRSIKVWGTQAPGVSNGGVVSSPHFNLLGHDMGVNCLEYSPNGEKPYIVSGGDDNTVRVWDYQTKQCVNVLSGHTGAILSAAFHGHLPIILSGGEDGLCNLWHSTTYRSETSLKYEMGRVWGIATDQMSNAIALATDEGTVVVKLGTERAVASMQGGKIVVAKGSEIQTINLRLIDNSLYNDGERLSLPSKDLGSCEIFPQSLKHHPNGRLIAVCGDGEYIVYTSQALRNKAYGRAINFVWSNEGHYAVRDETGRITVYQNFKEHFNFKPSFSVEEMFGGRLIAIRSSEFVCFYDWQEFRLIRRIDVKPHTIYWNDDGTQVVLACSDSFFMLRHDVAAVAAAVAGGVAEDDDGIEIAFELDREVNERIESGIWLSGCFAFTTNRLRLQTIMAGVVDTIAFLDRQYWLLGYMSEFNRLYLIDRDLSVISYKLNLSLIEYQTAISKKDFDTSATLFSKIPAELHNKVARFLESQGHKETAFEVTNDLDHKFELGRSLGKLEICAKIIREAQSQNSMMTGDTIYNEQWKQLGDMGLERGAISLALACFKEAKDLNGLLLIYSSIGDAKGMETVANMAVSTGQTNIAVLAFLLVHDIDNCIKVLLDVDRIPEAALFAKSYAPSRVQEIITLWKKKLIDSKRESIAATLATPEEHGEIFHSFKESLEMEKAFRQKPLDLIIQNNNNPPLSIVDKMSDFQQTDSQQDSPATLQESSNAVTSELEEEEGAQIEFKSERHSGRIYFDLEQNNNDNNEPSGGSSNGMLQSSEELTFEEDELHSVNSCLVLSEPFLLS